MNDVLTINTSIENDSSCVIQNNANQAFAKHTLYLKDLYSSINNNDITEHHF